LGVLGGERKGQKKKKQERIKYEEFFWFALACAALVSRSGLTFPYHGLGSLVVVPPPPHHPHSKRHPPTVAPHATHVVVLSRRRLPLPSARYFSPAKNGGERGVDQALWCVFVLFVFVVGWLVGVWAGEWVMCIDTDNRTTESTKSRVSQ
jgi:hypothetical protein